MAESQRKTLEVEIESAKNELALLNKAASIKDSCNELFKTVNDKNDPFCEGYKEENPWTKGPKGAGGCTIM